MSTPPSLPPSPSLPVQERARSSLWKNARLLLIVLLTTELILRFLLGLGNPLIYQPDPDCGILPVANQDIFRFFSRVQINGHNMRSPEFTLLKRPNTLRIMFLGDSVSFGTTLIDQHQIFTSRLAQSLPSRLGKPVDILNASCGSWAIANETGYLRSRGTFDSDLVVIVINTEDFVQPFTPFLEHAGMPAHRPLTATGELVTRYLFPRLGITSVPVDLGSDPSVDPDIAVDTPKNLAQLATALEFTRARNVRLAIVYSPAHNAQWDKPIWQSAVQMLAQWASDHRVPLFDLTEDYAPCPPGKLYINPTDGVHLSELGHQLIAARLLKELPALLVPASAAATATAPR